MSRISKLAVMKLRLSNIPPDFFLMLLVTTIHAINVCATLLSALQIRRLRAQARKQARRQLRKQVKTQLRKQARKYAQDRLSPQSRQQPVHANDHAFRMPNSSVGRRFLIGEPDTVPISSSDHLPKLSAVHKVEDLINKAVIQVLRDTQPHIGLAQRMRITQSLREALADRHSIRAFSAETDSRSSNSSSYYPSSSSSLVLSPHHSLEDLGGLGDLSGDTLVQMSSGNVSSSNTTLVDAVSGDSDFEAIQLSKRTRRVSGRG